MQKRMVTLMLVLLAGSADRLHAQQSVDRFSGSARAHDYVGSLLSPLALLGVAAATAVDELRDDPPEWNVGKRGLSNAGRLAVQETVHHGVAAVMNRSTWYYPCSCSDSGARVGHAFGEAFTDHDRTGGTHLSIARIAGAFGGAYAETTWRPGRSNSEAAVGAVSSLLAGGVVNLYREFVH